MEFLFSARYGIRVLSKLPNDRFDAVILSVSHDEFTSYTIEQWTMLVTHSGVYLDLKDIIPRELNPIRI